MNLNFYFAVGFVAMLLTGVALDPNGNTATKRKIRGDDLRGVLLQETAANRSQQSFWN